MMTKLKRISAEFKKRKIDKDLYTRSMHDMHKALWEYCDFIRDKNVGSIKISKGQLTLTTGGGISMICDPEDERAVPLEILNFGDYEIAEMRMMRKFLKKDSVVIDIGANIGWYTLNLSKCIPHGRIIAFEPIPDIFKRLKKKIVESIFIH